MNKCLIDAGGREVVDTPKSTAVSDVKCLKWIGGPVSGVCPNCGEYCYNNNYFCSETCNQSYMTYWNN